MRLVDEQQHRAACVRTGRTQMTRRCDAGREERRGNGALSTDPDGGTRGEAIPEAIDRHPGQACPAHTSAGPRITPTHPSDELPGTGRHRKGSDPGSQSAGPRHARRLPRSRGSPHLADRTGKDSGVGSARADHRSARNRSGSSARRVPRTRGQPTCARRPAAWTRDASANSRITPRERVGSRAQPGGWPRTHGPRRRASAAKREKPLGATADHPPWARKS